MRVIYDAGTDTLSILLSDRPVVESDERKPGVILHFDTSGNVVSLEILDASKRVDQPTQVVYELMPASSFQRSLRTQTDEEERMSPGRGVGQ